MSLLSTYDTIQSSDGDYEKVLREKLGATAVYCEPGQGLGERQDIVVLIRDERGVDVYRGEIEPTVHDMYTYNIQRNPSWIYLNPANNDPNNPTWTDIKILRDIEYAREEDMFHRTLDKLCEDVMRNSDLVLNDAEYYNNKIDELADYLLNKKIVEE